MKPPPASDPPRGPRRPPSTTAEPALLVVVTDLADAQLLSPRGLSPRVRVITADAFLDGAPASRAPVPVVNLCRSTRYGSRGYYVSLLADARGQRVSPTVDTLRGLLDEVVLFRALAEAHVPLLEPAERAARARALGLAEGALAVRRGAEQLAPAEPDAVAEITVTGGRVSDPRFRALARRVHDVWPHPLLELGLVREQRVWKVWRVAPLSVARLDEPDRARLAEALAAPPRAAAGPEEGWTLGVLFDPEDPHRPSDRPTIDRLARVGARLGVHVAVLGPADLGRLGEVDALFLRTLTGIHEPSFRFARRAEALGIPCLDDTRAILRCGNKVYLHELLSRAGLPMPATVVVSATATWASLSRTLGTPVVLKLPDGSFSRSVVKVATAAEFDTWRDRWLARSPRLVAQAFLPTSHDWRVTVLDGRPLFVCRYHMARGHWQIAKATGSRTTYGRVEAVARADAPADVVALATEAARLLGEGLYGVDLKVGPDGPVVIEVNDNPNLDVGLDDAADGAVIYEDLLRWYGRRLRRTLAAGRATPGPVDRQPVLAAGPRAAAPYRPYEVVGLEIEYPIVDARLEPAGAVEGLLARLAGRATSDVVLGDLGASNEIVDHVVELKNDAPLPHLADVEAVLAEGVRRVGAVLADQGLRLLPTAMHPWLDPRQTRLWRRSNRRIYDTYARLFDVGTHGWANVQATHVNLPYGDEADAAAMMQAAGMLVPYLPALAASSPMVDGVLQPTVCTRLAWIVQHQARVPASCGDIVPEPCTGWADYERTVIEPMYDAVDALPDAGALRREYFNARGAVFKRSRTSMEVRVLDTQECVKMDVAVAAFVRGALAWLAGRVADDLVRPPQDVLVADFHAVIRDGSRARVRAPHLLGPRGGTARDALAALLEGAAANVPTADVPYVDLAGRIVASGSLSERMAAFLAPHADRPTALRRAARRLYEDLAECLLDNRPWPGRGLDVGGLAAR